ncbi:UNVERIFIED_CONTAM: hypothetical protein RMT77_013090 [Armadillidium vulgare]
MSSRADDETEKGEKESLLKKENDDDSKAEMQISEAVKREVRDKVQPMMVLGEPVVCERLIRARKSLTRSHPIVESFDDILFTSNLETQEENEKEEQNPPDQETEEEKAPVAVDDQNTQPKDISVTIKETVEELSPEKMSMTSRTEEEITTDDEKAVMSNGNDEEAVLDNLSASLSVIRMEKFALEKRRVSRILHRTFVDPDVEQLFQIYHERQRRADLFLLFVGGLLIGAYCSCFLVLGGIHDEEFLPLILFGITSFLDLALGVFSQLKRFPESGWTFLPFIGWSLSSFQLILLVVYSPQTSTPRQALLWLLLFTFLFLAVLPLRLLQAFFLSLTTSLIYFIVANSVESFTENLTAQIIGSLLLVGGANLLGLMSYFFADKKHRRAFLETRKSLEVKMIIEEQSKEQERLLLSVLPKHVAETMRQDMGRGGDGQFKKIYMSRHENVSILFADIVGFTAISSTYTASELVKMLNELFARFDGLAEKYQQLRIKILGDCYYCISGAPKERPDHAILCVHMGLSMIDAIKYVRETTGCGVDMRVGIHTGAVLAGVLGQRQWQFDVYSKDVFLANKMESSGKSGRVHISNTTLQYLDNNFEYEPAYGEKREDALRAACLKTYFISKVNVPHKPRPSLGMIKNGAKTQNSSSQPSQPSKEVPSDNNTMVSRDSVTLSTVEESRLKSVASGKGMDSFTSKLQRELVSRDGRKDLLNKTSPLTLTFRDEKIEDAFRKQRETFSGAATTALPLVVFIIGISRFIIFGRFDYGVVLFPVSFILVFSLTTVTAARSFKIPLCECIFTLSDWVHSTQLRRGAWFFILAFVSATFVYLDMFLCNKNYGVQMTMPELQTGAPTIVYDVDNQTEKIAEMKSFSSVLEESNYDDVIDEERTNGTQETSFFNNSSLDVAQEIYSCHFAAYYSYFILLVLLSTSLLAQMNFVMKSLLLFLIASLQCIMNLCGMKRSLFRLLTFYDGFLLPYYMNEGLALSIELILLTFLMILLSRQMEAASRLLYLWRREVEDQRNRAEEIRQRNEALVYNILPPHVATHFMGMRRKKHEELYSQSYEEVGVLFASMPNFGDFYSEESVNNQGLECYRFLNEVISDFDGLLERSPFNEITKIKTIGSTYMAASGLNPSRQIKENDPITVRWAHLALLVDFAFELGRALQSINEQSFNHFVLRMGINHGPIIAGVIGARKPHYDIWGNTVNVASRMESTGKAGCIQTTEETTNILRNFGYIFEQRGLIAVKGKGELMTYYLVGKGDCNSAGVAKSPNHPSALDGTATTTTTTKTTTTTTTTTATTTSNS